MSIYSDKLAHTQVVSTVDCTNLHPRRHVMDKSDRTSSVPITVLRLLLDKGQGLRSGLLVSINRVLQVQ